MEDVEWRERRAKGVERELFVRIDNERLSETTDQQCLGVSASLLLDAM